MRPDDRSGSGARQHNLAPFCVASPEPLPTFLYHPDPLGTGSLDRSDEPCEVCGRSTGFIYQGPFYAVEEVEAVCPWCIADGSAADRFDGQFTDLGGGGWDDVPLDIKELVLTGTPGFSGWQQETWLAHCGDAAVFLGRAGAGELLERGPQAIEAVKLEHRGSGWDESEIDRYISCLDRNGEPTAYLFQCKRCGAFLGYSDSR